MKSKKGISAIVAWVLLLGLTIGLATTVFLWTTRQTEEMTEHTVRFVEGGMQCENVMINVANVSRDKCNPSSNCCLKISNTRDLNIEKIILRSLDPPEKAECCMPLEVKDRAFYGNNDWSGREVEVMPIVKVNGESVGCKNKAITVEC